MLEIGCLEDIAALRESLNAECKLAQLRDIFLPKFHSREPFVPVMKPEGQEVMA